MTSTVLINYDSYNVLSDQWARGINVYINKIISAQFNPA